MAGRSNANATIALALAAGETIEEAATKAGVHVRTVHRRLADPKFRMKVDHLRDEMVSRAVGKLADILCEAVRVLRTLLDEKQTPNIRLGAARAILELGMRLLDQNDLLKRISALEAASVADQAAPTPDPEPSPNLVDGSDPRLPFPQVS